MVGVEQWAEIRWLHRVEQLSIREISRRTGLHRKTVRRSLAAAQPPRYSRSSSGSKIDPFKDWICERLREDPAIQSQRLRELATELGYEGGKSIFDDYVREVRPRFATPRTFQRTVYRPGELVQVDLWEPRQQVAVGHGQTRRGWVVTSQVCWSRAIAGSLIFSRQAPDILWALARNLKQLGALPQKLVCDREAAIAAGGRPTDAFAAFCGQLEVGWVILAPRDPEAKGVLERSHRFMRTNFLPGRVFANQLDFQDQLDAWCDRVNGRVHRGIRAVPADRLTEEHARMRPLPELMPDTTRREVIRVPAQPLVRVDRNDYSISPVFAGRRVEVCISQAEVTAVVMDTGELAARHQRRFAGGLTIIDPAHQTQLERQRQLRRLRDQVEVEQRPLARYDQLIPA